MHVPYEIVVKLNVGLSHDKNKKLFDNFKLGRFNKE